MLQQINVATVAYFLKGSSSRSPAKVNIIHSAIKTIIEQEIREKNLPWTVKEEQKIPSINFSGKKKCDVVVYNEHQQPIYVFPIKFIMTSYIKNRNNMWENLCGEMTQIKMAVPEIRIVPVNIMFSEVPRRDKDKMITAYEKVSYKSSFEVYEQAIKAKLCYKMINLIVDVTTLDTVYAEYKTLPTLHRFNENTPFPESLL